MLSGPLEAVDEAALRELVDEAWQESGTLDFKRELPRKDDKGRSEFLKDVCAFANSSGGDLVFGIDEKDGVAVGLEGIVDEPADAAIRRLGQVVESGMEPRIQGIQFRPVDIESGGYVLVVRTPSSFDGPHRYHVNSASRFVYRSGTHTAELTYQQLHMAFDRNASLAESARKFRADRVHSISLGQTFEQLREGPYCVVHILPFVTMTGRTRVDIGGLFYDHSKFAFDDWGGSSRIINLDGLISFARGQTGILAYTLIFRTGAIEGVRFAGLTIDPNRKVIPSLTLAQYVRGAIDKFSGQAALMGVGGAALLGVTFVRVSDYLFGMSNGQVAKPDRHTLILPDVWVDNLDAITDVDAIARPILDSLWQCFGEPRCELYDRAGKWNPPNR
jgi:hypothetical protein